MLLISTFSWHSCADLSWNCCAFFRCYIITHFFGFILADIPLDCLTNFHWHILAILLFHKFTLLLRNILKWLLTDIINHCKQILPCKLCWLQCHTLVWAWLLAHPHTPREEPQHTALGLHLLKIASVKWHAGVLYLYTLVLEHFYIPLCWHPCIAGGEHLHTVVWAQFYTAFLEPSCRLVFQHFHISV